MCSEVKRYRREAGAKASLNRAIIELHVVDAKPGDLAMTRMKSQ
jgi:hypothetical protein